MKVAIICGAGIVSGKEIMALELGRGLRKAGIDIHFVTSRWGSGEFGRRTEAMGFATTRLWIGFISATLRLDCILCTLDQLRRWPGLLAGYRRFLRECKPTRVVHTNWHHILVLWPFLRPKRDIYWAHEVMANTRQYRNLFQRLGKRIGCFVAVSHAAGNALARLGVPGAMIHVIYNGIADPVGCSDQTRETGGLRIGIVGQIGAWKGHEELFHAFKRVRATFSTAELHVFGDGASEYVDTLRDLGSQLGVESAVTWHGFVSDLREIYENLSIVTIPSRHIEPFGMTAVEAALFALPVVASRCGGLTEIIEDGQTGFLVEPGNSKELADRISLLLQNRDSRVKMGQKARKRALEHFNQERLINEFIEVMQLEA